MPFVPFPLAAVLGTALNAGWRGAGTGAGMAFDAVFPPFMGALRAHRVRR